MSKEMSRKQAIKYLRSSGMSEEQINTIVAALSAEPMQWIPVSERLPEESDFYLVSVGAFSHPVRVYKWDNHQWKDEEFKVVEYAWFVKAWTKIPKPYESEGTEDD